MSTIYIIYILCISNTLQLWQAKGRKMKKVATELMTELSSEQRSSCNRWTPSQPPFPHDAEFFIGSGVGERVGKREVKRRCWSLQEQFHLQLQTNLNRIHDKWCANLSFAFCYLFGGRVIAPTWPACHIATWPRSTSAAMVKFEKSTVKSRLVHGSITFTFSSLCRRFFRLLLGFLFLPFSLALLRPLHAFLHSSGSWVFG